MTVDFTSLDGGAPATIPAEQLVDGWRQGLHARKKTFRMAGHYRIDIDGADDTATTSVKDCAYNVLDEEPGGGMREVWDSCQIPLAVLRMGGRRPT